MPNQIICLSLFPFLVSISLLTKTLHSINVFPTYHIVSYVILYTLSHLMWDISSVGGGGKRDCSCDFVCSSSAFIPASHLLRKWLYPVSDCHLFSVPELDANLAYDYLRNSICYIRVRKTKKVDVFLNWM